MSTSMTPTKAGTFNHISMALNSTIPVNPPLNINNAI